MSSLWVNPELLNRYLAPEIVLFTSCDAPDMSEKHLQASHWLSNHFLNSVLRAEYDGRIRPWAMNVIYRSQVAFSDYHEASLLTSKYIRLREAGGLPIELYFHALARWESCFLNVQIFVDVVVKMKKSVTGEPLFSSNDGTPMQRAYDIASRIKHFGSDLEQGDAEENTVPMWLTNTGFKTRTHELSYHELAKLVSGVAAHADELQDPWSHAKPDV